ncbi:tyrosine-protein kinase family protein [Desulfonema magnum]|uniref:AAA ATPase domain-containing protein n=1 Tax=Desulfonema magnum TaxID=45655 RepID=A0A975BT78_9BACT|nr:AAA family ATPase [Desulfonema magnum]QTA91037.1 AAA ATPase domain-containing protein [Desulfonema magnum]
MLIIFEAIRRIAKKLEQLKEKGKIRDFRLILKLNMTANLFVVTNRLTGDEIESVIKDEKIETDLEKITEEDFLSDDYYTSLFDNTKPLDLGLRRTLSNIINYNEEFRRKIPSCPIVLFYSYKGGVGRTTALVLFASYYAVHHGKKVFILDCDFEAPGMLNFFGFENEGISKNGIVEYIKDKEAFSDITLSNEYVFEVSKNYSGNGEIYILPAGNIMNETDRDDYLEALARLDIHSTRVIGDQLENVMADINSTYHPDVILIDSKTGFNDIFGIIGNRLADIVVGFLGNNTQNKPGLHFFLDTLLRKKRNVGLLFVNSIISTSFNRRMDSFREEIDTYIQNNLGNELDSLPALPVFGLSRNNFLEDIGTSYEDTDDFIALIEQNRLGGGYDALFQKLGQQVDDLTGFNEYQTDDSLEKGKDAETALRASERGIDSGQKGSQVADGQIDDNHQETEKKDYQEQLPESSKSPGRLQKDILDKIYDNYPEPYAESVKFNDDFIVVRFYFRKCMEDIFNHRIFLLLGSKGTGKTAFYKALKEDVFLKKLAAKAGKNHLNYKVADIISLADAPVEQKIKFFDISNFNQSEIADTEFFYKRFWVVYIWNAVMLDSSVTGFSSELEVKEILNDAATADRFHQYISDKNMFKQVENELNQLDNFLAETDAYLMIIFDQLDQVVKPKLWSDAISPLIKYCQTHSFRRIFPKLFVRKDLFDKLGNLTNKMALEKLAVTLEWTTDELYSFFFKTVFANAKTDFFEYAKKCEVVKTQLSDIEKYLNRDNSDNQLPAKRHILKPFVEIFFGKYADMQGSSRFGEMYDWMYKNLANADRTISLRPFLDMIKYAIEKKRENPSWAKGEFPILSPKYIANMDVRVKAVERHFYDLANEEGNEILRIIFDDIRDGKVPEHLRISPLLQEDFESLLQAVIQQHEALKNVSVSEIEEILKLNGIVFVTYPRGVKRYTFAFLYKYFLGLRGPQRKRF